MNQSVLIMLIMLLAWLKPSIKDMLKMLLAWLEPSIKDKKVILKLLVTKVEHKGKSGLRDLKIIKELLKVNDYMRFQSAKL